MSPNPYSQIQKPDESAPQRLAAQLTQTILQSYRPGEQLPSLRNIAEQHGHGLGIVRMAISDLKQVGVVTAEHGRGIFVTDRAWCPRIGLLSELDLLQPHLSDHFRSVTSELVKFFKDKNVDPEVYLGRLLPGDEPDEPTNQRIWDDMSNGQLSGLVVLNVPSTHSWKQRIAECPIPKVGVFTNHTPACSWQALLRRGLEQLKQQGSQRIALLGWSGGELLETFQRSCLELGLDFHPHWVRTDLHPALQAAGWEEFREIWSHSDLKPDGLIVADDKLFPSVQQAILELGIRVPVDLKVITHVNAGYLPTCSFPVTFLQINPKQDAEALGNLMMQQLTGQAVDVADSADPIQVIDVSRPELIYTLSSKPAAEANSLSEITEATWSGLEKN